MQIQLELHYITQHYATLITLHYITPQTATTTTLHYTTLHNKYNYTTLRYNTLDYTTLYHATVHYSTLQYTTLITPRHNCNCNYTTLIALHYNYNLQLQLHYVTTLQLHRQLQLHYTTLHPAVVVRWPLQPLQPLQKTQLQPPFGSSVDALCHPWVTTANLSYRFHIFETSATALCSTAGTWVDTFAATLMVHVHEVTYVLIRCALFMVHELILLLLRSSWIMYMEWHTCWYAAHSSWYMSWNFCCYVHHGSCTWSDIRVDTLFTLRGTWVDTSAATLLMVHVHEVTYVLLWQRWPRQGTLINTGTSQRHVLNKN